MLRNADAEALMQNARAAQAEGERRWAAGDWQNAAKQGWLAVRDATAALVLTATGAPPPPVEGLYAPEINRLAIAISKLSQARGGQWERLDARFAQAANLLHDQTYHGRVYHEDLDELLREAWDYIRIAEELAEQAAGVRPPPTLTLPAGVGEVKRRFRPVPRPGRCSRQPRAPVAAGRHCGRRRKTLGCAGGAPRRNRLFAA